jgi:hypothetical protein
MVVQDGAEAHHRPVGEDRQFLSALELKAP